MGLTSYIAGHIRHCVIELAVIELAVHQLRHDQRG